MPTYRRRRSIIREFSNNTSAHGIPGIARSQSIASRIFWTVSFLAFTSIMMYFIIESIQSYLAYPTQTTVSVNFERSQKFPAVSICNYSPVRFDTFIQPFRSFTNSHNFTDINDTSVIYETDIPFVGEFLRYLLNNNLNISRFLFPLSSMLMHCLYNGIVCSHSDFIPFLSSSYGLCYTFNAKMLSNHTNIHITTENGGSGKLDLRLYAHSHQYVPYLRSDGASGIVTMIHDNTELPIVEIDSILLSPGQKHKVSYKKRKHELLPHPYSNCTTTPTIAMRTMFSLYEGADYAYSQTLCYTLCQQAYIYKKCQCLNPFQWTARFIVLPGTTKVIYASLCGYDNLCYIDALTEIRNIDSIREEYCSECSQACSTTDFFITTSSILAPPVTLLESIKNFVENSTISLPNDWNKTWETHIRNDYVGLEVASETSLVEIYKDEPLISEVEVLSNIGGHTGLWIGISFLSIMEVVEMLFRLIKYDVLNLKTNLRDLFKTKTEPI